MKKTNSDKKWTKEFAERLEWRMHELDMEPKQLAKVSGLTITAIAKLLKGDTMPYVSTVIALSKALLVTPSYFIM